MMRVIPSSSSGGSASPCHTPGLEAAVEDLPIQQTPLVGILDLANRMEKTVKTIPLSKCPLLKDRKIVLFIEDGSMPIRIFAANFNREISKDDAAAWTREVTVLLVDNHEDAIAVLNERMAQVVLIFADCEFPRSKGGSVVGNQGVCTVQQIREKWPKPPRIVSYSSHGKEDLIELGATDRLFDGILGKNPVEAVKMIGEEAERRR